MREMIIDQCLGTGREFTREELQAEVNKGLESRGIWLGTGTCHTYKKTTPVDSYLKEPIPPPGAERHREAVKRAMILVKHKIEDGTIQLSDEDKEIWEELKKEGKVWLVFLLVFCLLI